MKVIIELNKHLWSIFPREPCGADEEVHNALKKLLFCRYHLRADSAPYETDRSPCCTRMITQLREWAVLTRFQPGFQRGGHLAGSARNNDFDCLRYQVEGIPWTRFLRAAGDWTWEVIFQLDKPIKHRRQPHLALRERLGAFTHGRGQGAPRGSIPDTLTRFTP